MKVTFIGQIDYTDKELCKAVKDKVVAKVEKLIIEQGAEEFVFAMISCFVDLCWVAVTELKEKYPQIKRIYRGMMAKPKARIKNMLNKCFEECTFPKDNKGMGFYRSLIISESLIDESDYIIAYYDEYLATPYKYYEDVSITMKDNGTKAQSGTKISLNYAFRNDKKFDNIFEG